MRKGTDLRDLERRAIQAARASAESAARSTTVESIVAGDLAVCRETAELPIEWAVIDQKVPGDGELVAGRSRRLLIVPADTFPLRGGADLAVTTESGDLLILRGAFGVWVEEDRIDPNLRSGRFTADAAEGARAKLRARAADQLKATPSEREAEADPEYLHWVDTVLRPAHNALEGSEPLAIGQPVRTAPFTGGAGRRLDPGPRRRWSDLRGNPWAVAASVLLVAALGFAGGSLRQAKAVEDLLAEKRDLSRKVAEGEDRQRALIEDGRHREAQHRREIAERDQAARKAEQAFRDRMASLEIRLREALTPRSQINLPFEWLRPVAVVRGEPQSVDIPPTADRLVLILQYTGAEPFERFDLALYPEGRDLPVWEAEGLVKTGPAEFTLAVARDLLAPGLYRVVLLGIRATGERSLAAEYEFLVE